MLSGISFLLVNAALAALVVQALVGPLSRALTGRPKKAWQAQGVDYFSLAILLLIPLALFMWQRTNAASPLRWQTLTLLGGLGFVWWRGVGALAQMGIRDRLRRFVFLGVLVPLGMFGSPVMMVGVIRLGAELVLTGYHKMADSVWLVLLPILAVYLVTMRATWIWILAAAVPRPGTVSEPVTAEIVPERTTEAVHSPE